MYIFDAKLIVHILLALEEMDLYKLKVFFKVLNFQLCVSCNMYAMFSNESN